jgi:hypothetical protein
MVRMTTTAKRVRTSKARPEAKLPSAQSDPQDLPFLRFYHSVAIRTRTLSLIGTLELAEDPTKHSDALANLVVELTNSGMDYYFIRPLKLAKPGFLVEQSANLGMVGVQQVLQTVIRRVVGRMDSPQLISVCRSIQQLMR